MKQILILILLYPYTLSNFIFHSMYKKSDDSQHSKDTYNLSFTCEDENCKILKLQSTQNIANTMEDNTHETQHIAEDFILGVMTKIIYSEDDNTPNALEIRLFTLKNTENDIDSYYTSPVSENSHELIELKLLQEWLTEKQWVVNHDVYGYWRARIGVDLGTVTLMREKLDLTDSDCVPVSTQLILIWTDDNYFTFKYDDLDVRVARVDISPYDLENSVIVSLVSKDGWRYRFAMSSAGNGEWKISTLRFLVKAKWGRNIHDRVSDFFYWYSVRPEVKKLRRYRKNY
jgi:hypothetical protein